jgi:hypothetical protein
MKPDGSSAHPYGGVAAAKMASAKGDMTASGGLGYRRRL